MKKILALISIVSLITLTGWTSNFPLEELSEQPQESSNLTCEDDTALASNTHFDCVAIGKCKVIDGGGEVKHFANWSGDAVDRPAAINNVKAEWYRTARNRGCTKDFEIFLVSCQ